MEFKLIKILLHGFGWFLCKNVFNNVEWKLQSENASFSSQGVKESAKNNIIKEI